MDWTNSVLGRPSIKKCEISGHKSKLCEFQRSKSIENTKEVDEFAEEDVWGVIETEIKHMGSYENGPRSNTVCRQGSKRRNDTNNCGKRMNIPTSANHHDENGSPKMEYQSVPINIPHLPQILNSENYRRVKEGGEDSSSDGDNIDEGYKERIPPHKFIAVQIARSQLTSFSVYEGAGRTLKGRDLSRVRNAILTRTGFIN
ncbi:hypothetical protein SUGI_1128610 [Cryptomeria japonica]|uniref:protein S40-1 n=1 Tax=Cryptomeria japonica TaxID=3369 RepID=UPI002414B3B7|nr:protein S40-1 [Cryptomeria japonica]GLJ52989.1 hypothetical protein SUGI_1128610 [Cryptomeria japonica]